MLSKPEESDHLERDAAIELRVSDEHAGQRLDHVLTALVSDFSRSQLQRLVRAGRARVNGRLARASTLVRAGSTVRLSVPPPQPARPRGEPVRLAILYEDADLMVIDKPPGMVVHPAAGHAAGTLVNALLHHTSRWSGIGGEQRPGIVHRLDRGTSGLMVVAKHDQAHRHLAAQFRDRTVEKEYVALVWGVVQTGRRIEAPIGRDAVHRTRMTTRARRAREAVTRIVKTVRYRAVTLAHVRIMTGRTHQIRVHLSAIGHPVVGDAVYGGVRRHLPADLRALKQLERPFLHAARLAFDHPRDDRRVEFLAPLPPDLQAVLGTLTAIAPPAAP